MVDIDLVKTTMVKSGTTSDVALKVKVFQAEREDSGGKDSCSFQKVWFLIRNGSVNIQPIIQVSQLSFLKCNSNRS